MKEAAIVVDMSGYTLYIHVPRNRSSGSIPDSHDLWEILWQNRKRVLLVAHSHPGGGTPSPSMTDLTTWEAIEAGLGRRLIWPIMSSDKIVFYAKVLDNYELMDTCDIDLYAAQRLPWLPELWSATYDF